MSIHQRTVDSLVWPDLVNRKHHCATGLEAWWITLYGGSNKLHDIAGGHHVTLTNMETEADWNGPDERGFGSLSYGGTDEYCTVPHTAKLMPTGDLSLTAWVKSSSSNLHQIVISKFNAVGVFPGFILALGNNTAGNEGKASFWCAGGWVIGTSVINDGEWHHIAGVLFLSSNTVQVFVDGQLEISATRSVDLSNTEALDIGRRNDGFYMIGEIDDVRLYSLALREPYVEEIWSDAPMGHPLTLNWQPDPKILVPAAAVVGYPFSRRLQPILRM